MEKFESILENWIMQKELLTIEFRYRKLIDGIMEYQFKTITIGVFDTLIDAIDKGNECLKSLAKSFEVRSDDHFKLKGLFGKPKRLVTNTCYPTKGVEYFAKITQLRFDDLVSKLTEVLQN